MKHRCIGQVAFNPRGIYIDYSDPDKLLIWHRVLTPVWHAIGNGWPANMKVDSIVAGPFDALR